MLSEQLGRYQNSQNPNDQKHTVSNQIGEALNTRPAALTSHDMRAKCFFQCGSGSSCNSCWRFCVNKPSQSKACSSSPAPDKPRPPLFEAFRRQRQVRGVALCVFTRSPWAGGFCSRNEGMDMNGSCSVSMVRGHSLILCVSHQ